MCGIVGYIGNQENVQQVLIRGLKALEYRGYDSAGIALYNEKEITVFKNVGNISALESITDFEAPAEFGIGHTRWATHGAPSVKNSHPHQSADGRFALVHNGIIENYVEIKETYLNDVQFNSETDTEVAVQLIAKIAEQNPTLSTLDVFFKALEIIKGAYAFVLIDKLTPNQFFAAKNKSPLLAGIGSDFNMVGSDMMAMIHSTNKYYELSDGEVLTIAKDGITIYDGMTKSVVTKEIQTSNLDTSDISKGHYEHYMLKEINEQPAVIRQIIQQYRVDGKLQVDTKISEQMKKADRIYILAAGTSYNAGLVGKQFFEKINGIPCEVHVASEFVYNTPIISKNAFFIFLSQSGETADSRACLKMINEMGYQSLTITNVEGSTLSREANFTLLLHAGPEIAVASTKAYTAQITVMAILADSLNTSIDWNLAFELSNVANVIEATLTADNVQSLHEHTKALFMDKAHAFYIGRGIDYAVGVEASLKLKEISYIHTEGFAAGELKHGTIALIEEGTPVVVLISGDEHLSLHTRSNAQEVIARGANTLTIAMERVAKEGDQIVIGNVHALLTALVTVIPTQLLAYFAALELGQNIDQPRNLAKSVTVE